MKKFRITAVVVAMMMLLSATLTGCGGGNGGETAFDAASVVAGFEQEVSGTVKLNYVTNYKVDVVRPGEDASGMDSFKRDVVATAEVEMDLGAEKYIKVTKTRQDLLIDAMPVKTEELLFAKDGKYFYQSSSSQAVEVADAAAKLAEIFETATYEQIGGLTLDALVYNALDKNYELKTIGLSETFMPEDLMAPTYAASANGGLNVTYKPEYVGYRTDGGWSDFSNSEAGYAAVVDITTNDKGYVTSMKETYNSASLVFNIMSNPPTVTITGERSFTASYGDAITKVDTVELSASVANFVEATNGSYVVMTCAMGDFANMAPVNNGDTLALGNIICVKATANDGYELASVSVNGAAEPMVDPAMAGGFYCFAVNPGANAIEVLFKAANPTDGIVTVTNNTDATYELQSFTYAGAPTDYKVITDGVITPGDAIFGAIVVDSTKAVDVYVNGVATSVNIPAGPTTFYCFAVKEGGKYEVVISAKGEAAPEAPAAGGVGVVKVTNNTDVAYEVQSFTYAGAPTDYKVIENGEIEPGASIFGAIVVSVETPVSVVVNGTPTSVNIPAGNVVFYCFSVKEAGEFNVEINAAQ